MERLLTAKEVAELLNVDVSTVYQLVYKQRIHAIKISRRCLRFNPAAIERWLKNKEVACKQ